MSEITEEMVEAAEAAVYGRHERGFLLKPLVGAIDMRAAITAALQAAEAQPVANNDDVAKRIVQAVCELQEIPDPDHDDTIIVTVQDLEAVILNHLPAPTPSHSLAEAENADIIPNLDLLSPEEKKALLAKAENLWRDLERNELGGYSYGNRPFYILEAFRSAIEDFGKRNTGYRHSKNEINAHESALSIAEAKP